MIFPKLNVLVVIFCVSLASSDNGRECYNEFCGTPIGLIGVPIFLHSSTCGEDYLIRDGACPLESKYCCPAISGRDGVILCKDRHYLGGCKSYSMHGKQCINVDSDDNNAVNSVNTLGNCVRLYDDINCSGKSRALYPGSLRHNDLLQLNFNDKTSSFGKCYDDDYCGSQNSTNNCASASNELTVGILSWVSQDRSNLLNPVTLFQTGPYERTEVMEALIRAQHLNTGTVASQRARNYAKRMGNYSDEPGHILSARLGGSGTDLRNIFPQSRNFNRGKWNQVETFVADVVQRYGGAHFSVNLLYQTTSDTKPYEIVYRIKSFNSDDVIIVNDLLNSN
ncbi:uncharacterized protein LOC129568923 [Sitodiplosis mosellana]|uniref:uncharacterized protein LOC129568923 n=1 Tax=Sitodiplosis mosellana TaxID=263140 RepID=UPI002444CD6D|nr:uncharacterized protein LOC129568923 [Sitodiplosis mosellana]